MDIFDNFPIVDERDRSFSTILRKNNIGSLFFGNRFKSEQTLYEYLIEFLLVFVSPKDKDLKSGEMEFHCVNDEGGGYEIETQTDIKFSYWAYARMGLRRFIFYDKFMKKGAIKADEEAYDFLIKELERKFGVREKNSSSYKNVVEHIEGFQDLFHGYAVVIKNRFWGAQALLPVCPEFIVCSCEPSEAARLKKVDWENKKSSVDTEFDFTKHNFIARGGEMYYLHILQGLIGKEDKKKKLEMLLKKLMVDNCKKLSLAARFVQDTWEKAIEGEKKDLYVEYKLSYIPRTGYKKCEQYSIDELICFLSNEMHQITKIDVMANGVMFQVMRMMSCRVSEYLGIKPKPWIIDMGGGSSETVKKIAAEAYIEVENDFMSALNKFASEYQPQPDKDGNTRERLSEKEVFAAVRKAKKESVDIFRTKGKELKCIIPVNGKYERFSISENILRFLVLAFIEPGEKMTLDMFLDCLYEHYGIVIGPREYRLSYEKNEEKLNLSGCFIDNLTAFQNFLKATGFLRELSDATSIVVNPYTNVLEE